MAQNIVEKILKAHLKAGEYVIGKEIGIRIDQTLTQDATGTMAFLQFEALGLDKVQTDLSLSYVDHNTVQIGFENNDDHAYLQSVTQKFGVVHSRAGNGICHQVHLERFGKPGTTLLGSDSHTTTGGGIGQLAIGAGGLDIAVAMGGGNFYTLCPKVYKVNLTGKLRPWVTAKDIVLKMLSILSTKGNVGVILEYGGEGVATLSVPQRATIANMGAEMGVTTSIFPSDNNTRTFLKAQQRESDWIELKADPQAQYERILDIDLAQLEPLAACPHSPGNIKSIRELEGMKVDQVCIGSCTNASYRDMTAVGEILDGNTVHRNVSLGIAPGSRQVFQMITQNGTLLKMINSGARILENACGFCIGNHFSPGSHGISLRTSNRNFEGRSGTQTAEIYLVSPEIAALSALNGKVTRPEDTHVSYPTVMDPEAFSIDDSLFVFPSKTNEDIKILRGPNIGTPPKNDPLPPYIAGEVMLKLEDNITTDHIMPAGPRLKYRSNIETYARYVFEHIDADFSERCLINKKAQRHNILVAGESYGQGSSREHAAMCPMYLGIKMVLVKSIERIHAANLVNFGILPLIFNDPGDYDKITAGDCLEVKAIGTALENPDTICVLNKTQNFTMTVSCQLSDRQKKILLAGGLLNHTRHQ
ncbi:aconitate hydratase [Desulfocicer niacini]